MLSYTFKQDPAVTNKAVFYLRYSSENQTENSIEGQRRECKEFAKKHNIDILGEYVDRAKTGTNDNRPDFQRMIHDSYKKVFGNVIVWKSDRFSRDRLDSLKYRRELFNNGVKVLSVTEPNIDGPMGTLFDSMNDGMNQLYSEELSVKVKRGQNENVINGKSLGGYKPIGYNIVDSRFVIDEKEGPIVQEVFDLYGRAGLSMLSIAKRLEAEGKRKNDGRPLVHNHLEKIISNEKYIGVLKCQGKRNDHAIPALVSKELFDLCQSRRTKRKHKNFAMRGKEEYYLSGKVFCSKCGSPYLGESGTSKNGTLHTYYKCNGAKHQRCDAKSIRKDDLENVVCTMVLGLMRDDLVADEMANYIYGQQKNDCPEVVAMKNRRLEVETQINNFVKAIGMGIVTETTKSTLLALEAERKQLDDELARQSIKLKSFSKEEIKASIAEFAKYDYSTPKQKRALLNTFVSKLEISDGCEIKGQFNLFGYLPSVQFNLDDMTIVRINTSLLRHSYQKCPISRAFLFFSHTPIALAVRRHLLP